MQCLVCSRLKKKQELCNESGVSQNKNHYCHNNLIYRLLILHVGTKRRHINSTTKELKKKHKQSQNAKKQKQKTRMILSDLEPVM